MEKVKIFENVNTHFNTELAFLQKLISVRGIKLYDFKRIHDEGLAYVNSVKTDYVDCKVKLYDEYLEFLNPWEGSFSFSSDTVQKSFEYLTRLREKLHDLLNVHLASEFLEQSMKSIEKTPERGKYFELNIAYRNYINSVYNYNDIDMTVQDWLMKQYKKVFQQLEEVTDKITMTQEDWENRYSFSNEDYSFVHSLFLGYQTENLETALRKIVPALITNCHERAYLSIITSILSAYISGLEIEYWFKVVTKTKENRK